MKSPSGLFLRFRFQFRFHPSDRPVGPRNSIFHSARISRVFGLELHLRFRPHAKSIVSPNNNHNNSLFLLCFNFGMPWSLSSEISIYSSGVCQVLGTYHQIFIYILAVFGFLFIFIFFSAPEWPDWTFSLCPGPSR